METLNIIYAVKGGIPSVGISNNPNFYLLCYDFNSNIGFIEQQATNSWKLYTRSKDLLNLYSTHCDEEKKFYHYAESFQESIDRLQEVTGRFIKVLTKDEVIMLKEK